MFDSPKLPPEAAFLIEAAGSAPSADNSQPWCFEWEGQELRGRVHARGGFPPDHHATLLALGAASENLACALDTLGVAPSTWSFGSPGADGVFAAGSLTGHHAIPSQVGEPLWKRRHTNRLAYRPEFDSAAVPALESCGVGDAGVRLLSGVAISKMARWVRQASEVRFQTRQVNEWFAASLRYGNAPEDHASGLHVGTLALPPGGVALLKLMSDWRRMQWLNRIRAFKFFAAVEAANFGKTPLVAAIIGPPGEAGIFSAGRCLQRVWLKATEFGLSAQPYYVVTELLNRLESNGVPEGCLPQAIRLQQQVRSDYGADVVMHCLLRIGKPIGDIQVAGRLSVDAIMCARASPH